jgi:hypothetical protein
MVEMAIGYPSLLGLYLNLEGVKIPRLHPKLLVELGLIPHL